MKKIYLILLIFSAFWISSCNLTNPQVTYHETLVVFGNLNAGYPMTDTVFVSRSAAILESVPIDTLYIPDAVVTISDGDTTILIPPVPNRPGRYLANPNFIFQPGHTYTLYASWDGDSVQATTTLPDQMDFSSVPSTDYSCSGSPLVIDPINVDNATMMNINGQYLPVPTGPIDTVIYKTGDCYTQSFASVPYFLLDFNAEDYNTVRIISYALESKVRGLEPYNDLNQNGIWEPDSDSFLDYNRDGLRDSTFTNLVYDTSFVFRAWKGPYLRDQNNDPYRYNPFVWSVNSSPTQISWLFFNYYGLQLMAIQATDQSYYDYFSGDPFGSNQYRLPDSNVEGGYGLFSSTYTKFFYVYIKPEVGN